VRRGGSPQGEEGIYEEAEGGEERERGGGVRGGEEESVRGVGEGERVRGEGIYSEPAPAPPRRMPQEVSTPLARNSAARYPPDTGHWIQYTYYSPRCPVAVV
jgi:hypothetical protein